MKALIQIKKMTARILIALVLPCFAFSYTAEGTGNGNTAVRLSALQSNSSNFDNTAIGIGALFASTADSNTAVGSGALSKTRPAHSANPISQ
jgi:hypothetical protein